MPISAILFGGRRATNVPLVIESFDWAHGVFLGSIMTPRPPRPRPAPSASSGSTRSPCCRSAATTWATTSPTGWGSARPPTPQAAQAVLGQLVPPGRGRFVPVARLRREQPGAESGSSSGWTARVRAVDTPIGVCRPPGPSTPVARPRRRHPGRAAVGRRRDLAARAVPDRGPLRSSATASPPPCLSSSWRWRSAWRPPERRRAGPPWLHLGAAPAGGGGAPHPGGPSPQVRRQAGGLSPSRRWPSRRACWRRRQARRGRGR